jgi:hypothetical protein
MTIRPTARRPKAGAPGFKALVTAVSLAVTLGGWAVIAANTQQSGQAANNTLPPMPTLVPTPAPYVAPAASRSAVAGGLNSPASNPAPRPRAVTIDPSRLPAPMAITRSSR